MQPEFEELFEKYVDRVAMLCSKSRVPPSTVYMDGSHNPRPSERLHARQLMEDFFRELEDILPSTCFNMQLRMMDELEDMENDDAE